MEDLEYEDYYYDYDYDIEDDDYNEDDYIQGYDIILTGWNQSKKRRTGGERRRRCYEDEEEAKEVENILEDIAKFNFVSYSSVTQSVTTSILKRSLYARVQMFLVISSPSGNCAEAYSARTV